ncbi:membrane cofactor protein-like isoform X6 [Oryx dammah]|uniref:membrane cofactor protein-like isoform X6 n=1 Tax=Oryx dammah TaxID=59534 RepID=UPI001A9B524D|nr:membrane cofactor protein-like isoform X6 [Oryx dammah]
MRASCAPRKAPPRRSERLVFSGRFVGVLLLAPLLLLPTSSDACDDPPVFVTMKPQGALAPSYGPGDRILYECRLGFQPVTPGQVLPLVCQDDNTWSSLQEACKRKLCSNLADPINGQVIFVNGSAEFGSQAHYVCNKGYYLIGASISHCDISGSGVDWSDSPPTCEKILCKPPEEIPNGKYTNSHKDVFEYNEVVTYSCDPSNGPDEYSLIGESKLICVGNDEWSSQPPQCKVVRCEYPVVENGMILSGFGQKYYYKATVVFKCKDGFNLHGDNTVVCGENSSWEPELPKCIKVSIPSSTHPPVPSTHPPVPSTHHPIPSVSVSTRSTHPPMPSASDSKPISPTVTPRLTHPGHPSPTDATPPNDAEGLGAGFIVLIIAALLALDYCFACTAVFADERRKGKESRM